MKPLPSDSYFIRPFKAFKGFTYTHIYPSSSNNSPLMTVEEGIAPANNWIWPDVDEPYNVETGRSKRAVYASVETLFYPSSSIDSDLANTSRRLPEFTRFWSPGKTGDIYIVSLSQRTYGERIRPGSFLIAGTGGSISDDGAGRLISSNNIVGNIFYEMGIAVISAATGSVINNQGMYLVNSSTITVSYDSQLSIYEHTVVCTLGRDELNYSSNPSLSLFASSSVITGSTVRLMDAFSSGSLTPYVTTIGMYNSVGELVAIAKPPRAIKRIPDMDQTFIIRFDT